MKPIIFYFLFPYLFEKNLSFDAELPTFTTGFLHWLSMELLFSVTFFLGHGMLHKYSFLYKHIHKVHHTFHETIGFAAQFSHVLENFLAALYVYIAMKIVQPHVTVFWVYLFTRYVETTDAHSGYEVPWRLVYPWASCYPWSCGASMHDYHHSHNLGTYGGGIVSIDWLFGTDKDFKEYIRKKRRSYPHPVECRE